MFFLSNAIFDSLFQGGELRLCAKLFGGVFDEQGSGQWIPFGFCHAREGADIFLCLCPKLGTAREEGTCNAQAAFRERLYLDGGKDVLQEGGGSFRREGLPRRKALEVMRHFLVMLQSMPEGKNCPSDAEPCMEALSCEKAGCRSHGSYRQGDAQWDFFSR